MYFYRMGWLQRNREHLLVTGIYFLALAVAYFPLVTKNFSADDFRVLWRVCHDQQFVTEGFFRMVSDVTLYVNYLVGGYQPVYFNLFNLLLHLACSLLIYLFCLQTAIVWSTGGRYFAFCSGFFFLLYPFHSEAVIWIVGRGASLSTFFALIAICVSVSDLTNRWKYLLAGLSYLTGLLAYEAILSLPLIVMLIHWMKYRDKKAVGYLSVFFGISIMIYFALRVSVSGSVFGAYGAGIAGLSSQQFAGQFLRVMARLIAPPNPQSTRFLFFLFVALAGWGTVVFFYVRSVRARKASLVPFGVIALLFLCSLVVAVSFPVSTRTTSTDRLLYFPSVFICIALSLMVSELATGRIKRMAAVAVLGIGGLWGIMETNRNWSFASDSTTRILAVARELSGAGRHVFLLNVPDEHKGAYMLAGVLDEALLINGADTSRVHQVNLLLKEERGVEGRIRPVSKGDGLYIFPGVRINRVDSATSRIRYLGREWICRAGDQIWYWDRAEFRRLE
jgi:hypothetical protein